MDWFGSEEYIVKSTFEFTLERNQVEITPSDLISSFICNSFISINDDRYSRCLN